MADASPTPAEVLRGRLRKYFLVVFAMFAGAILFMVVLSTVVKLAALDPKTTGTVLGVAASLAMLSVVAGSWVAVSKLWRCPACDQNVYWLVSWNMSVFASAAKSTCPRCGVELFTVKGRKRTNQRLLILVAIAVAFGLAGAMASGFLAQKAKRQGTTQQQPPPPG